MPLPGPLRQSWTLTSLLAPAAALALAGALVGCAPDQAADTEPASEEDTTLDAPEPGGFGADPGAATTSADTSEDDGGDASYADVEGSFLMELGAAEGSLALEVRLARVLVHVDGDVVAVPVSDAWIPVAEASGRWSEAWLGELPTGLIEQLEVTLDGEARIDGESWTIPGAWRDLFLDVPFESGDGMPLVVLTGLLDTNIDGDELQPWLEQTVLRQVDADGLAGPYGDGASSR